MQVKDNPIQSTCTGSFSELEFQAVAGMLDTHALLQKHLYSELQEHHALLPTEYDMLFAIARSDTSCARMTELAQSARLSISAMSRLANRMEERGIVARQSSPEDGRGWNLSLTHAGEGLMRDASQTHFRVIREYVLQYLTPEDLESLVNIWSKIPTGNSGCS